MLGRLVVLGLLALLTSCGKDTNSNSDYYVLPIPEAFPEPYIPEDNQLSWDRVNLGKRLFYDPILSSDSSISCASCHKQDYAFADNIPISPGVENRVGRRNSMSLVNLAYHDFFMREGGVPTLEMQALVPIHEHNEMGFNIVLAAERLQSDSSYYQQSVNAYARAPDSYVITRALASFQRTLISGSSRYDERLLNASELRGEALFYEDALACYQCHGGFLFTNQGIENNGLYLHYEDSGRYMLTFLDTDIGRFKVPTLRNIAYTSPYMHDGSLETLDAVIEHYASGGKNHPNKSEFISGFSLTDSEKNDLINFLKSLSDTYFLNNEELAP